MNNHLTVQEKLPASLRALSSAYRFVRGEGVTVLLAAGWVAMLATTTLILFSGCSATQAGAQASDEQPMVRSVMVTSQGGSGNTAYEGVVEAVRQTTVGAQVPGAVVTLQVKAGDKVRAGQILMRLDARAANQAAVAGAAQVKAAQAALTAAAREFGRQQQLAKQGYISQTALDWADARYKTAQAEASAQLATARAARTQSDLYVVKAPYDGIVADVFVVLGDMAMPGRQLLALYDPTALRITAAIPQTAVPRDVASLQPKIEVPGADTGLIQPARVQLLPTVDAASHTLELRMDLPAGFDVAPGMFARAWVPNMGAVERNGTTRLFVPSKALVRRSEFSAVYVISAKGKPLLRQVRPGRIAGNQIEILSGVSAGERIAVDPQAAAKIR